MRRFLRAILCFVTLGSALVGPLATSATAGPYSRLQVLLPGESPAPGTASGKTGSPRAQTVGVPFQVTVRACDTSWNLDATITSIVQLTSSDETATLPSPTALAGGQGTFTVTLNAAGTFTVQAHDQTDTTIPDGSSSAVAALLLHGFTFERINQKNQYAGVPMPMSFEAVDPSGNRVTGFSGPVKLKELTSFGEGRVTPDEVTLTAGFWSGQLTLYRADETAINRGNVNLYAYLDADPSRNGTSDPFTVHPGTFSRVQLVVPGQSPAPGSIAGWTGSPATQGAGQAFTVQVYATDAYWNPLYSGDTVRIISSDSAASTPVSGALTNGFRQFTVSLGTVGTQTLTVTDQTNGAIQGMTSAGIPVIPASADHFEIDNIAGPLQAGTPVTVTVRATDSTGNTIPDYAGDAILAANTGPASISPEAITIQNGVWTGPITFRGAGGAVSFTVSDYSVPAHTGTSNTFVVNPGPYVKLQVLLPGQTARGGTVTGFTGTPTAQIAGSAFSITVRAVDAYWNRVAGVSHALTLSSTDAFATFPASPALSNGEAVLPVTLYRSGSQTITAADAEDAGKTPHTSSAVQVTGGPYARLVVLAPGEQIAPGTAEGRTGTATDQSINYAFTVTVVATDSWFNPVGGPTDVVHLTSTDPLAQLPADEAMVDGVAEMVVRLSTGGFQQLTASNVTQPAMPTSTTQVRAISSGFHLEATATPATVKAGDNFTLTVRVVNDAGSVIQEVNTWVDIEVQNASTREPGRGAILTARFQLLQGQRSIAQSYTFAEPILIIARDEAGNDPAVVGPVVVIPGDPVVLQLTSNPSWVGGNKHATLNARVMDAYDNGVPTQAMAFALISGEGTLTPIDSATDDAGNARCDFLSPRTPQLSLIRATSGALTTDLNLETAFVDPNAPGGTLASYPNPFHPGETPTTIAWKLSDNATVRMRIYTLSGGLVLDREYPAGQPGGVAGLNEVSWDGRNGKGDVVASGGYILLVEAQGAGETLHVMRRKLAVVR